MENFLAKVGLKAPYLIAGVFGGIFLVYFGGRPKTIREKIKAITTVILSAISTGYLTPLVISCAPDLIRGEYGIAFIIGLFGMGLIHGFLNMINDFIKDWSGALKELVRIIRGR